jgi:hypothetical protein
MCIFGFAFACTTSYNFLGERRKGKVGRKIIILNIACLIYFFVQDDELITWAYLKVNLESIKGFWLI